MAKGMVTDMLRRMGQGEGERMRLMIDERMDLMLVGKRCLFVLMASNYVRSWVDTDDDNMLGGWV